jgi:CubicO group peptidase (beta-lactamase class C family)
MLSFTRKTTCLAIILIFTKIGAFAQFDTTALSSQLNKSKDKLGKEVAFMLYKDGKVLYKKEIGGMTVKTPVPIGASSQWLTTALVMTYVQEGKISLDDKVSSYLPIFSKYYKGFVTIRHCLTNATGIKSEEGVAKILQKNNFATLEAEVNDFASKRDIMTNAGTETRYSNVGFNIAGRVLEVVTKRTFERLMQERIIRPLAMKNTTFTNENYNDAINPSTGAKSTASDMTNFLAMLLNKGSFNNKPVLTEASVLELQKITAEANQIKNVPKAVEGSAYGLGQWKIETTPDGKPETIAVPSLNGIWPMIDICKGYAFVLFTGAFSGEQRKDFYMNLKGIVDDNISGGCK